MAEQPTVKEKKPRVNLHFHPPLEVKHKLEEITELMGVSEARVFEVAINHLWRKLFVLKEQDADPSHFIV